MGFVAVVVVGSHVVGRELLDLKSFSSCGFFGSE